MYGVAQSQTRLKRLSSSSRVYFQEAGCPGFTAIGSSHLGSHCPTGTCAGHHHWGSLPLAGQPQDPVRPYPTAVGTRIGMLRLHKQLGRDKPHPPEGYSKAP